MPFRLFAVAAISAAAAGCPDRATLNEHAPSEVARFPRLTHAQWERTVQDLLRLPAPSGLATTFHPDPPLGRFENNVARLELTSALWRDYQRAAEDVAARVGDDPALVAGLVPPDAPGDPRAFVTAFGLRAFRRPLTTAEVDRYTAQFTAAAALYPSQDSFTAGVQATVAGMLQSPYFLDRAELSSAVVGGAVPLDGYELASRLSYLLWNTMPDEALFAAAAAGALATEGGVRSQAHRMLDDPRATVQLRRFHGEAFALDEYDDVEKDPIVFPGWRNELGAMMEEESGRFFDSVIGGGGGLADLLTSNRAFVNADLAALYEVPGDFGADYVEVELDPGRRAGFLTRVGFLARNATLTGSDPIHRGVFVNLSLVCRDIPTRPDIPDNLMPAGDTTRARVESITGEGTCGEQCHAYMINPPGFAFEHYDAIGRWRDDENGLPIDSTAVYRFADGRTVAFAGAVELSRLLAEAPEVHACYAAQLVELALGRDLTDADQPLVDDLAGRSHDEDRPVRELIVDVVTSRAFRFRPAPAGGAP